MLNVNLDGRFIGTTNWGRFDSPTVNRLLRRAAGLDGQARYRAYAELDAQLARDEAPMLAVEASNDAVLVSARVGCVGRASTSRPSASGGGSGRLHGDPDHAPAATIPAAGLPSSIVSRTPACSHRCARPCRRRCSQPRRQHLRNSVPSARRRRGSCVALVAVSMRVTVSSPSFATQTAPSPYASAIGRRPTLIVQIGPSANVTGSKRCTVASPALATQTAPPPTTTAVGLAPARVVPETRRVPGSIRASVESPYTAHTWPWPSATAPAGAA